MEIYYAVQDHGDGSAGVKWFKNKKLISWLVSDDTEEWSWGFNGGTFCTITLPDDTDLSTMGLIFSDMFFDNYNGFN